MNDQITPEELNVALLKGVNEGQYRMKRQQYAIKNGTTVAALQELNQDDLEVIQKTGMAPDVFRKQKLADMAADVIYQTS